MNKRPRRTLRKVSVALSVTPASTVASTVDSAAGEVMKGEESSSVTGDGDGAVVSCGQANRIY